MITKSTSAAFKRITKEIGILKKEENDEYNVKVHRVKFHNEFEIMKLIVHFNGPIDSPYENTTLSAIVIFPEDYPLSPFKFNFITKMWHPNVYTGGKMCISMLRGQHEDLGDNYYKDTTWTPVHNVKNVIVSISSIIVDPNLESPANIDASKEFREDKNKYFQTAKKEYLNSLSDNDYLNKNYPGSKAINE